MTVKENVIDHDQDESTEQVAHDSELHSELLKVI